MKIELSEELKALAKHAMQAHFIQEIANMSQRMEALEARVAALEPEPEAAPLTWNQIIFDKHGRTVLVFDRVDCPDVMVYFRREGKNIMGWNVYKIKPQYQSGEFLIEEKDWLVDFSEAQEGLNTTLAHLHSLFDKAEAEVRGDA